jgi:hypothetical protein
LSHQIMSVSKKQEIFNYVYKVIYVNVCNTYLFIYIYTYVYIKNVLFQHIGSCESEVKLLAFFPKETGSGEHNIENLEILGKAEVRFQYEYGHITNNCFMITVIAFLMIFIQIYIYMYINIYIYIYIYMLIYLEYCRC